jgi:two-component system, response regulator PdtaR
MSRRVVIAEDEAIIRLDLKEILQDEGYDVVGETGRGDEAVDLVRQYQPDLVILDVKMPGSDGLAAARAIHQLELKVAVLILTAFSQRNLIDEARDAGVAAYLVKPFQRIELIPAIDQAISRCEQEWAIDDEARQTAESGEGGTRSSSAEDKLETRRLVDAAKGQLMERSGMSESEAFGYIQKTAMTTRSRMIDVARQILEGSLAP